jgi:hypothetical protein
MTFEEYEKASKGVLRAQAKECFDQANQNPSWGGAPTLLLQAQFYMQELDRRHDSFISLRDLILEIIVISLIGGEIWLGLRQGTDEGLLMDRQNKILANLDKSTAATATLVQKELDLQYKLLPNVEYNGEGEIALYNNSKSDVSLWGVKIGNMQPRIKNGRSIVISDHNMWPIHFRDYNPQLLVRTAGSTPTAFPVELYLKDASGQEFVWRGQLTSKKQSGNLSGSPSGAIVAEPWSQSVKIFPVP